MRRLLAIPLLLAGCAGEPDPSEGGGKTGPGAPAPLQAPDTVHAPVLTARGLAPIETGMSLNEAIEALSGYLTIDGPLEGQGAEECRYATGDRFPGHIMFEGNRVVRVDGDSTVATGAGIRIGSREDEVRRAYPDLREEPHHYVTGHYLIVMPDAPQDTVHRLVFETDSAGTVTALRGGVHPQVQYVEGCA